MDSTELKDRISKLTIWKKNGQRAPHKPLLVLYALGKLQANIRYLPYEQVKSDLTNLLKEFGPYRKSYHPEEPFVRLFNDGIWLLNHNREDIHIENNWLLKNEIIGGFSEKVISLLNNNDSLVQEIATIILNEHFSETLHEDILQAVGLNISGTISTNINTSKKRIRDPQFRDKILRAYEYSCAVCGFNVRLGNTLVGVEAAHIRWHQYGGPDTEENGIALCAMHHKLFDRGVFTLSDSRELLVAEQANGTRGLEEWLMKYHGTKISNPIHPDYIPRDSFIKWHVSEVFRGPWRYTIGS